ncbi:LuxR C-terminal-related transcriptional regulator [Pseudescherichia vulneris]|uniref:response regulator transcription factor n=1 Tax=Pseudescherichia vulneris TaxID=566 RepID=UPI00227C732F|nr:LuxR C-terminal-related transcriptional regulator [Pseudescherichia vulneris]WAH51307.1 LuxR C-terminal-related transcriptional regulator [Pseudescherichia vulneris]
MLKILLIDRCYFTRLGLEIWLNQASFISTPVVVTGLNNLMLAKEHAMQWQPDLVIADLYGFASDLHHVQQLSSLLMACSDRSKLILFQSGHNADMENYCQQFPISARLAKTDPLNELEKAIDTVLLARPAYAEPQAATPLLTRQEEKVLSLWMEGTTHHSIASRLGINGKTVYTYKRNIRMKLGMCNRFTPFLSLPESVS